MNQPLRLLIVEDNILMRTCYGTPCAVEAMSPFTKWWIPRPPCAPHWNARIGMRLLLTIPCRTSVLRRLFESARDGILILDAGTRQITDVNPFMEELLGYSRDEFLGKELWEIGLLKDAQAGQQAFRKLQEEGYIRYTNLPLQSKEGEVRDVEFVSNVYVENRHEVIQCNIRKNCRAQ